ncbi:efflux RND transporter periplasmic adaptor subunit [Planctomyces sp. SH-PL62]|uniref:efflux RND transporter periplasmic adaptor subunit n=1 Tax=Planctomyces sp. SH-PL62 TaxID=1636152 RepID=UPI00078DEC01|nr:efflux RND transporter periplasmic adaptor subunit [Planctomyces sp. SH-PL62]AMV39008.1 Putative efflux system component YknX [Planctomyces sp. SH-PL62]
MQNNLNALPRIELERPSRRGLVGLRLVGLVVALSAVGGAAWAWEQGYRPTWLDRRQEVSFHLAEVDRGDIVQYVVEFGTIESAADGVVRCQVEALVGMVGGTNSSGSGGSGGRGGSTSGSQSRAAQVSTPAPAVKKSTGSASAKSATGSASKSGSGSASASTPVVSTSGKPTIRSFSYVVTPYSPLKRTASASSATTSSSSGSRGGGGGGGMGDEKPGSTRIISILPEGTAVKKGDVVCELDSAAFRDELKAQQIRWLQAKSYVEQATSLLAVNQITLKEYREGILPQDIQLIRQYVQTCEIEQDRAMRNLEWSRGVTAKGLRTSSQLRADELSLQQSEFVLSEAKGMLERLEKYTGPKILKSLEAKLASILTDKLAQDASFALEAERLQRLEKNVAACTLRATRDGVVVYINQTNAWGRVESVIQEGTTVRQDQPIFQLPDPKRMRIKARINETKVAMLRNGQACSIRLDAFPDRLLSGRVTDVTAISSPVNGPFSDVRVYFALIAIEDAFDGIRPGLSAEVTFLYDRRSQVDRLPLAAVRDIGDDSFVAVLESQPAPDAKVPYRWQKVELGLSDSDFVEVLSGVREGEQVILDPFTLEAPQVEPTPSRIASTSP